MDLIYIIVALVLLILVLSLIGLGMVIFIWIRSVVHEIKVQKEIDRKKIEFEEMRARVLKEQERIRQRMK